jgi:hypothetical protein
MSVRLAVKSGEGSPHSASSEGFVGTSAPEAGCWRAKVESNRRSRY